MFDHPQVAAEGVLATFEHARVGRYRGMAHPVHFGGGAPAAPFTAPELGQHSREILAGLGYSEEVIERLCRAGAVIDRGKDARR
jgi:formyl-CoA transferase